MVRNDYQLHPAAASLILERQSTYCRLVATKIAASLLNLKRNKEKPEFVNGSIPEDIPVYERIGLLDERVSLLCHNKTSAAPVPVDTARSV